MERLTVNKNVSEMNMIELAHNSCFAKDRKAMYRDYDTTIDVRVFVRKLIKCRGLINDDDEIFHSDDAFDEFMSECSAIDPQDEIGLIALFYRGLWAQTDLYEALKRYEDLEEQGLLLKLPCKVGDTVYLIDEIEKEFDRKTIVTGIEIDEDMIFIMISDGVQCFSSSSYTIDDFGETVFLTQAEADAALKKMKSGE